MTRRLLPALALSLFVALPSTAAARQAPLHPAPGDAPSAFKGVPGAVAKKKSKKKKKAASKAPVVTKVSPRSAKVGERLTISGKNFVKGKRKNRVYFYTLKGGAVIARDESASSKRIKVVVPAGLSRLLPANGAKARILIRIRGRRLGKRSSTRVAPLIALNPNLGPDGNGGNGGTGGTGGTGGPGGGSNAPVCPSTNPAIDSDQDMLTDVRERELGTNACNKDSDLDLVSDGYEYNSALHLNATDDPGRPYPWKTPYPNAMFPDAAVDYDGDGLTLWDEFRLWTKFGASGLPLNYSDGLQTTVAETPSANPSLRHQNMDGNGVLSDDERDADGDGLSNWDESHGRMTPEWWIGVYAGGDLPLETRYPITYAAPNMLDNDSDGDGLGDGADDQDFDGLSNNFEVMRPGDWATTYISVGPGANMHNFDGTAVVDPDLGTPANEARYYSRVQPFNPCKPVFSETCHKHPLISYYPDDEDWMGYINPPVEGLFPEDV